jgi:hypothetical protein
MTPLLFTLTALSASTLAGLLGSLVGVGGGIIVVPTLALLLGVDIRHAIAASIVAVVATSSASASTYVRDHIANIRLGMLLETVTVAGAIVGAMLAGGVSARVLYLCFGVLALWTCWNMLRKKPANGHSAPPDQLAERLSLHATYHDRASGTDVAYKVSHTRMGLGTSWLAGVVSGLLGVGGGIIKVPVMNLLMSVPVKAATATSNFMIGITAASGAAVYLARGEILPFVAAPVAIGTILGSKIGARLLPRLHGDTIKKLFAALLAVTATQMLLKGILS